MSDQHQVNLLLTAAVTKFGQVLEQGSFRAKSLPYLGFDEAAKLNTPADYWIWDGVHPTYAGHQLLADEWVRTYTAFYGHPSTEDDGEKQAEMNAGEN